MTNVLHVRKGNSRQCLDLILWIMIGAPVRKLNSNSNSLNCNSFNSPFSVICFHLRDVSHFSMTHSVLSALSVIWRALTMRSVESSCIHLDQMNVMKS